MTRLIVCGTPDAVATAVGPAVDGPSSGTQVRASFVVPGTVCDVYVPASGGTKLTDLVDDATGNAVTTIVADATGQLPGTRLPDGLFVNGVWLDPQDGSSTRFFVPARFGPADVDARYVRFDGANFRQNGQIVAAPGGSGLDQTARDAATAASADAAAAAANTAPLMWAMGGAVLATSTDTGKWQTASGSHGLVPIYPDRWFPTQGATAPQASAVSEFRGWIAAHRAKGLRCIGEVNLASLPAWARALIPQFKDQVGNVFAGNLRDIVFSQTGHDIVAAMHDQITATLTTDDLEVFDGFRLGGGQSDELSFPAPTPGPDGTVNTRHWWIFGTPDSDLAQGIGARPFAASATAVPFGTTAAGTVATSTDKVGYDYVNDTLVAYMRFLHAQLRKFWGGAVFVMHPSWGVRWEAGTGDTTVREQLAYGTDWERQIAAYPDAATFPWPTWLNEPDHGSTPQQKAPRWYIAALARAAGRDAFLFGETASGATDAELTAMYPALDALGYRGAMLVYNTLAQTGTDGAATLANVTALQQARKAAGRIRTPAPASSTAGTAVVAVIYEGPSSVRTSSGWQPWIVPQGGEFPPPDGTTHLREGDVVFALKAPVT